MARASAADQLVIAVALQEADGDVVEPLLAVARHRQPTLAGS
jgi:alpha-D-ribose 1-methylphosphonate 5-triphosphate synthase subunit PhnI